MDTAQTIFRSAKHFFAGTMLSRMMGLLRDAAMASYFGSSPEIAAFMVSYRLAHLFRRFFGEGTIQAGFVPYFTKEKERAGPFFRDTFFSLALLLVAIILIGETALWPLRKWIDSELIDLTMIMLPSLFFICLYSLNASLLQCQKKYFSPSLAPAFFNLIWISSLFIRPSVWFLSIAIVFASFVQWMMTSFEGFRLLTWRQWLQPQIFSNDFKKLLKPLAAGILGVGAVQINSALDAIFARVADMQGPAFLWYAIRIYQLPLALFGISLSGAILPPLARAETAEKKREFLEIALKKASYLMMFCTFGILSLAELGINLLYGHGDFTLADLFSVRDCLWGYGLGLMPSVFVLILSAKFYAEKKFKIPTIASMVAVLSNVILNAFFVFILQTGALSIALSTSFSAVVNVLILSKGVFHASLLQDFLKAALAGAIAWLATTFSQSFLGLYLGRDFYWQLFHLLFFSSLFAGTYWAAHLAFSSKQKRAATL